MAQNRKCLCLYETHTVYPHIMASLKLINSNICLVRIFDTYSYIHFELLAAIINAWNRDFGHHRLKIFTGIQLKDYNNFLEVSLYLFHTDQITTTSKVCFNHIHTDGYIKERKVSCIAWQYIKCVFHIEEVQSKNTKKELNNHNHQVKTLYCRISILMNMINIRTKQH